MFVVWCGVVALLCYVVSLFALRVVVCGVMICVVCLVWFGSVWFGCACVVVFVLFCVVGARVWCV